MVTHPVNCPPIGFPTNDPPFAEGEIEIHPYPLIAGMPNEISVRVTNNTAVSQTVNVSFQTSPQKFGIGLNFSSFDNRTVTLPAHGNAIVKGTFVPITSGHYCIQIVVTGPGLAEPLVTQRNLDVTEDLHAGVPDLLPFLVRNNTAASADISLVVDNTCPGWDAQIVDPAGGVLSGVAPGAVLTATLQVTPPNPVVLGSGCHIDVQAWIGDQMIGGIRKLDVPPVQLPTGVNPPWEEPEISFNPDPPVVGQPGQICIQLQNPLPVTRTVTVEYAVADFGAGVGFTTVATQSISLPPNSNDKYCAAWTPGAGGTLHRCVLVTLKQPGYQDMHSQRNVDLVRLVPGALGSLKVPFVVRNPDLVDHTLTFSSTLVGVIPGWEVKIITDPGDPPPAVLSSGETINLNMILVGLANQADAAAAQAANESYAYGDVSKIEVTALLDGEPAGGFTVQLTTPVYLPIIRR